MAKISSLNAHETPPEAVRGQYKRFQALSLSEIDAEPGIIDLRALDPRNTPKHVSVARWMSSEETQPIFDQFVHASSDVDLNNEIGPSGNTPVYTHRYISGLLMIPALFPPAVQLELLARLFHRDLSDSAHKTNLHLHYNFTYPAQASGADAQRELDSPAVGSSQAKSVSFFEDDPTRTLCPKDPQIHKPLTIQNILKKKLRWVTLGGQYDWTAKVYPDERPPAFPEDIAKLLRAAFPMTEPEAAILNIYSPGNTLSPHRDVSEQCDAGLISVSFGCDGLFLISHDDGTGCEIIRLRSGDAVYMDGTSRFAWHAVPKIISETCPSWLADWPVHPGKSIDSSRYKAWKGWMSSKRINLNVRQMASPGSQD